MSSGGVLGTGVADIGGGILGQLFSAGDQQKAMDARLQALKEFQNLNPTQNSVDFQNYQQVGQYSPQLVQLLQQDPSLMAQIQTNPQFSQASSDALSGLQGIAQSGGLQTIDQANLNKLLGQAAQQNQGQQGAIQQQMAQRGMGGSGFELASKLAAQQNAATQANQAGTDVAAQAQMRALQALQGAGQMGQSLQGQQFNQKSQQAQAQDLINNFNTRNSQQVATDNTTRANQGQLYNLQNAQSVSDRNTGLANQQQLQNNAYRQQYYNDQYGKASGLAGQYANVGQGYQNNANQTAGTFSQAGQGVGKAISADNMYSNMYGGNNKTNNGDSTTEDDGGGMPSIASMAAFL